jgi:hypothetical protein
MTNGVANAQRVVASIEAATAVREPTSDSKPARFSVGLRPGMLKRKIDDSSANADVAEANKLDASVCR